MFSFLRRKKPPQDWLDDILFTWPSGDPFTVRDCLRGIEVKGITGSGKSSGSGKYITEKILSHPRATLFIIAQKPEDKAFYQEMFARVGKSDRLIVMEEGSNWRCNFIADELRAGADPQAITDFLITLTETLEGGKASSRSNDQFWQKAEERLIYNAVEAVRQGTDSISAPDLLQFVSSAPYSPDQLKDADWRNGFHYTTMAKASAKTKNQIEGHDFELLMTYWNNEFPNMDDKVRTSIIAGVMNTLSTFNRGLVRHTCSNDTTLAPLALDHGLSILVNYPFANYGPTGRFIAGGMKYKIQKHILRRQSKPGDFFNIMVLDEFQESVTEFDSRYLAQCRSHYGSMFCLTQTVHSEYSAMGGGQSSQHRVAALTSNFGHHIAHIVDAATAKYFSDMLGMQREVFVNLGPGQPVGPLDEIMGQSRYNASLSESYQPVLQPAVFLSGRTGGPLNKFKIDGILIRSGEKFKNGENWQKVEFDQR